MMKALTNIAEEFWHYEFTGQTICPNCDKVTNTIVCFSKQHVKLTCMICDKVMFYRRVNLGVIE